jgi:citrate lyase beta subunit
MTTVDLNRFLSQIERLEHANRATSNQARLLSPKHHKHHPSQVMYGGAHLFSEKTFQKISDLARSAFDYAAKSPRQLADLAQDQWTDHFAARIFERVSVKLRDEALEDYRVDFEDGYGIRTDSEEDAHARQAAMILAGMARNNLVPRSVGFRIKPLSTGAMRRSLRTLSIFIESFSNAYQGSDRLKHMVVTLPKVTNAEQVATLADILDDYEARLGLGAGFFVMEILVESPEAFISADGQIPLPSFIAASRGRCQSLHFGVFDFTSSLGIGSAGQAIDHLACDFARLWMQVTAGMAQGMGLSDGIISRLPLVPKTQDETSRVEFEKAWRYNYQQIQRSLSLGFYQGWDLHPSQLPIRHIANHAFVLKEFDNAVSRIKVFAEKASTASHVSGFFDDRASVLGLLNFFDRAVSSGVVTADELLSQGVDLIQVRQSIDH